MLVAIAFYSPEEWAWLRQHADDRDNLDDTYADWLAGYQDLLVSLLLQGLDVVDMPVVAAELVPWLEEQGLPNISESRAEFATWKLQQLAGETVTFRRADLHEALVKQHTAPQSPEELAEHTAWKRIRAAQLPRLLRKHEQREEREEG